MKSQIFVVVFLLVIARSRSTNVLAKLVASASTLLLSNSSRKCNMHEITAPSRTWGFPSNLSCSTTDATTTGGAGAGVLRCKYIYMCPSTQQQQQQQQQLYRRNIKVTILECRRNGKWFGKLPDCSLGKLTRYRNELAAPAVAAAAPGSQAGVKPRSNFVNRETFRLICKAQKICERFRFASTCKYLRYSTSSSSTSSSTKQRRNIQELRNLCTSCHVNFCQKSRSIKLL